MTMDAVAAIKARLDIIDVVGGYVTLRRSGSSYVSLCPFHSESTPSFSVSQERQVWYCFGCQEGGDLIRFVEKIEGIDFRQTLEQLAERAGVEIDQASSKVATGKKTRLRDVLTRAQSYFEHVLWQTETGALGRDLLDQRGVNEEVARQFGAGFAPAGGLARDALCRYLMGKAKVSRDDIIEAGLGTHRGGGLSDRFSHRLTLPIRDERGSVIGFAGRAMGDGIPKYLNSPETVLYHKGSLLFGVDLARAKAKEEKSIVLVEGYFDVISLHAGGVENVVACNGTAVTADHATLLTRLAPKIVLMMDGDNPGKMATNKAVTLLQERDCKVVIAQIPEGCKDPDEVARAHPKELANIVGAARPEWEVLLEWAMGAVSDDDEGRREAATRVTALLASISHEAVRDIYVQRAATLLHIGEKSLAHDVVAYRSGDRHRTIRPKVTVAPRVDAAKGLETHESGQALTSWERELGAVILSRPSHAQALMALPNVEASDLHPVLAAIVERALTLEEGERLDVSAFPPPMQSPIAEMLIHPLPYLDDEVRVTRMVKAGGALLHEARLTHQLAEIGERLRVAQEEGNETQTMELLGERARLLPQIRRLGPQSKRQERRTR